MNKELFGVFGDRTEFQRFRSTTEFDRVVEGPQLTIGIRDVALQLPNRSSTYAGDDGACVIWGEVYLPDRTSMDQAEWLLNRYREEGTDALSALNGSYVACIDDGDDAIVSTDVIRSWECFYTDDPGVRVFGTNPAAVTETINFPEITMGALLEFVHLGVVVEEGTVFSQLNRAPFDGYFDAETAHALDRFVYEPKDFDYVDELARRLERALSRRAKQPGRKGMMLSGGYDSRIILAGIDSIDECYTVGLPGEPEVEVARKVANQYGANHRTLDVDEHYLNVDTEMVQYTNGISESLHIHQGGYDSLMNVETMYHGFLFDTFLRGHFLPRDKIEVGGYRFPLNRLDPDPDIAETIAEKFGFLPASECIFPDCDELPETSMDFIRDVIETGHQRWGDRYDSIYNGIALFGIQNQPSMPFRIHLADRYLESFVAMDTELVDWHLTTPPEYRNERTFLKAMRKIDSDILKHRPPDRPYDSHRLNEIEGFIRRKLPLVQSFGTPWPDRRELYDRANLDDRLFAEYPEIHSLPPRLKLRINDIRTWLNHATDDVTVTPGDIICPPNRLGFDDVHWKGGPNGTDEGRLRGAQSAGQND